MKFRMEEVTSQCKMTAQNIQNRSKKLLLHCTYRQFLIELSTTDQAAFLEIAGENVAAKLCVLVAVPGYVLLVHLNGLLVERK